MRAGLKVGKVLGITIRIDWSWFFILALMVWNLSTGFRAIHPAWPSSLRWGVGLIAGILFFASVLAHELAHSLVARSRGIPVHSISLFMFGGVSNIQQEPESPQSEFVMTLVGPLTSLVIGFALLFTGRALTPSMGAALNNPEALLSTLAPLPTLVIWLGSINVVLGFFNLLPAFPLDGGRLLRAILWSAMQNLRRATRWATGITQVIAWAMILSGLSTMFGLGLTLFGGGFANGLWIAFVGWFLSNAASASYQRLLVRDVLEGVSVSRMMRADPPVIHTQVNVRALVEEHIMGGDDQGFPVVDSTKLLGIVTIDDVRRVPQDLWDDTLVREIMTPADQLVTIGPDQDAAEALQRLTTRDVRQLPVLQGNKLVGLVRRRDIIHWLQFVGDESK